MGRGGVHLSERAREMGHPDVFQRRDAMKPTFTIGIEEEYQTGDPETRHLRSHIQAEILEKGQLILQERVKAEMHQSVLEVVPGACKHLKQANPEVDSPRR